METIKSYTDLEQSKKLAEILPLESADMYWYLAVKGNPRVAFNEGYNEYGDFELPCWSLAALLGVIPNPLICTNFVSGKWEGTSNRVVDGHDGLEEEELASVYDADNPVDACYELILKLHKLNLF